MPHINCLRTVNVVRWSDRLRYASVRDMSRSKLIMSERIDQVVVWCFDNVKNVVGKRLIKRNTYKNFK